MYRLLSIFSLIILALGTLTSCIEDAISTSPSDQPAFSVDTLDLGTAFIGQPTATSSFKVYNRHDKVMSIESIRLRDDDPAWRINVDGSAGSSFCNIEIRPNDSIFVMIEAKVPLSDNDLTERKMLGHVDFVTNGVTRSVALKVVGRAVKPVRGLTIERDTTWTAAVPFQIFDSLAVAPGVTLTLDPGVELRFHDAAYMAVRGRLVANGTSEAPIVMTGDRIDNVVADIPFDVMAAQWDGVTFHKTSTGNRLAHTVIKNMTSGVLADSCKSVGDIPALTLVNCRIRNSASTAFLSYFADVRAIGTEFSDASQTPLLLCGGTFKGAHLTVANYYLFTAIGYPLLTMTHYDEASRQPGSDAPLLVADIDNSILYGLGDDINVGDLAGTGIYIRSTVFKSAGTDDEHFIGEIWETDPLYLTVRDEYLFDYRLKEDSPVLRKANPALLPADLTVDFYGTPYDRTAPTPGAFQP